MHHVSVNAATGLVEVKFSELMSAAEVAAYIAELKREFMLRKLSRYVLIVDVAHCPIQSQNTVLALGHHMATMPKASAIAVVVGASPIRMQVRRLFTQPYARIVTSPAEARAWVLGGVDPDRHACNPRGHGPVLTAHARPPA